jgi:hypothetical protein
MYVKWMLVLVCLEIMLVSVQHRCTVCTKHTIGLEIIWDAPDGTPRWRGSSGSSLQSRLEIVLISAQDRCMVCAEVAPLEIILGTPDGTSR